MSDDRKPSPTEYRQTPRSMPAVVPPQPKTTEMAAVKVPSSQLDELLAMGKAHGEKLSIVIENVELLQHDAKDTKLRIGRIERELDEVKERQTRGSGGVRQLSQTDAKHEAAIANLTTEVTDVKTDVSEVKAMLAANNSATDKLVEHASKFAQKHPAITTAFVNFLLAALAYATWRLQR